MGTIFCPFIRIKQFFAVPDFGLKIPNDVEQAETHKLPI